MHKIRTLIVDDAVVVRRLLAGLLAGDPALEVVGTAPNGRLALVKIGQLNPDVVTLDLEMPEMDGLETLAAIRQANPLLPVVMLSRFTQRGAVATLDALALGARDYVTLPENAGSSSATLQCIREQLIPKLKQFGPPGDAAPAPVAALPAPARPRPASNPNPAPARVEVLAIGASTGGPSALAAFLPTLSTDCPVPVVIVQHMPPVFTRQLAERLRAQSAIPVAEATAGITLEPGQAWLAPGDFHLTLGREGTAVRLRTHQGPPENSCRPSVDVLFRSVVEVYGAGVLAVVLTGMGQDGTQGCEAVRLAGGQVLVQDEASSVVWGMPGSVAKAGLAEQVLPLDQLGAEVVRRLRKGRPPASEMRSAEWGTRNKN